MELGERETLWGVEFGALYLLQLLMKVRNGWSEFGALIQRISHIADGRFITQVAVAADCARPRMIVLAHLRTTIVTHACWIARWARHRHQRFVR
jgi:hypothetical protein